MNNLSSCAFLFISILICLNTPLLADEDMVSILRQSQSTRLRSILKNSESHYQIKILLTQRKSKSITDKIDYYTKKYINTPYISDPLGEGATADIDGDPGFLFNAFDCTTFVETIISLSKANSTDDFIERMKSIRYTNLQSDKTPLYLSRNHFPELDWTTNNIANGTIEDVTESLGDANNIAMVDTSIDKSAWIRKLDEKIVNIGGLSPEEKKERIISLHSKAQNYLAVKVRYPYLKLPFLAEDLIAQIRKKYSKPALTVFLVNIVRPNWESIRPKIGTNLTISHQGFLFVTKDKAFFRHASSESGMVTETTWDKYVEKMTQIPSIGGIQILEIKSN